MVTSTPSKVIITSSGLTLAGQASSGQVVSGKMSEWKEVMPGEEVPFEFSSREKLRHRVRGTKICIFFRPVQASETSP